MDIQAMQSMDWLFKKERIYLLAQFWQQVSPPAFFTVLQNSHLLREIGLNVKLKSGLKMIKVARAKNVRGSAEDASPRSLPVAGLDRVLRSVSQTTVNRRHPVTRLSLDKSY